MEGNKAMTVQEIAAEAAREIRKLGWWSKTNRSTLPVGVCIFLAVGHACDNRDQGKVPLRETVNALLAKIGYPEVPLDADDFARDLIMWNDAPGRTEAEVLKALELVAAS